VVGTHGRSFWILDDITPLRQISSQARDGESRLFKPQVSYRVRRSVNTDTPIPQEEPMGQNPPDGAIINYYLKSDAPEVVLEIFDKSNRLVWRFSSADKPEQVDENQQPHPSYWVRPPQIPQARAGMQRFVWDLHYAPPEGFPRTYPISAIYRNTPTVPQGPAVMPGEYTIKLSVGGKNYTEPLTVKMDPRVPTPTEGIAKMFEVSFGSYEGVKKIRAAQAEISSLRAQLKSLKERAGQGAVADAVESFDKKAAALDPATGGPGRGRSAGEAEGEMSFARLAGEFNTLMAVAESADARPTAQAMAAYSELQKSLDTILARWNDIKSKDLNDLNEKLRQANLSRVKL
jgi:hypothetical protein